MGFFAAIEEDDAGMLTRWCDVILDGLEALPAPFVMLFVLCAIPVVVPFALLGYTIRACRRGKKVDVHFREQ